MLKKTYIWLFTISLFSCSPAENKPTETALPPSSFEQVSSEIELLLPLIKNNNLILDSSTIRSYENSYALVKDNQLYRSEQNFDGIILKRIFNTKKDIITSVHFDFYYDSTSTNIKQNVDSLLNYFVGELGGFSAVFKETIAIYSWKINGFILDFEVFENGYTITLRKNNPAFKPVIEEEKLAEQFVFSQQLITAIFNNSIALKTTSKEDIKALFPADFLEKPNALAFNKTFDKKILLSASFLFDKEKLSALYFDYIYKDTTTNTIISSSKIVKSQITKLFNNPSDVAMVPLSTSYKWSKNSLKLEVYANGVSIILEE